MCVINRYFPHLLLFDISTLYECNFDINSSISIKSLQINYRTYQIKSNVKIYALARED